MTDSAALDRMRSYADHTPITTWFRDAVRVNPDSVALRWRAGDDWPTLTFGELAEQVTRVAGALRAKGIGPGDRVLLMLRNRPEFHVLDLAALLLRATPISIYNSSAPEQIGYLAGHSKAVLAVVDDLGFLARLK